MSTYLAKDLGAVEGTEFYNVARARLNAACAFAIAHAARGKAYVMLPEYGRGLNWAPQLSRSDWVLIYFPILCQEGGVKRLVRLNFHDDKFQVSLTSAMTRLRKKWKCPPLEMRRFLELRNALREPARQP